MSRKPSAASPSETPASMHSKKNSAIQSSESDDLLSQFVRSDFDTANFVKNAVKRDTISDDLTHLRQGIAILEIQLREQVVSHHGRLIEQVSHAKDLEIMVTTVTAGVSKLQASLGRVKAAIKDPYVQLQSKTLELDRLQFAGEMLRRVIRVRELSDKLRKVYAQVDGKDPRSCIKDLTQGAGHVFEIQSCIARGDLGGIHEIERQRSWLHDMDSKIQAKAYEVLRDAVLKRQQADIGSALQVFQQVEGLGGIVERLIGDVLKLATAATREALDTSTLPSDDETGVKARSTAAAAAMQQQRGPSKAHAAAWKTTLWSRMETLTEALLSRAWQVWTLRRVLCAKRDAVTQQTFLELVATAYGGDGGDAKFFRSFWVRLFSAVGKALQAAADQNQFVRGMLTQDVARLRACFVELYETWVRDAESSAGQARVIGDGERSAMLQALEPFLNQHLSRVRSRLTDAVDAVLGRTGGTANPAEALALQKLVASTAGSAKGDDALSLLLAKAVQAVVTTFVQRARESIARDSDARAVSGHVTASHSRNFALYNAALNVIAFEGQLGEGAAAREVFGRVVQEVGQLVGDSLEPLFAGLDRAVSSAIITIHEGPLDAPPPAPTTDGSSETGGGSEEYDDCSLYMRRTAAVLEVYLSKLAPRLQPSKELVLRQGKLVERVLGLFVRHALLVSGLKEMDKMRLVRDMTKLEEVAGRLSPLKDLGGGQPYAALRTLRPLLFVDDSPLATLAQRLATAAAAGRLRKEDLLHALVQRAGAYLSPPFLCTHPPSPARAQVLDAYSAAIDADGSVVAVARVKADVERAVDRSESAGGAAGEARELLKSILALTAAE